MNVDVVSGEVVDAAFRLHRRLGPGLLESVYEILLARMLVSRGLEVERQKAGGFEVDGVRFDAACRVDLLVASSVIVEVKSVERLAPVHGKQLLTYLRVFDLRVGLLINFGAPTLRDGIHRVVNDYQSPRSTPLPRAGA